MNYDNVLRAFVDMEAPVGFHWLVTADSRDTPPKRRQAPSLNTALRAAESQPNFGPPALTAPTRTAHCQTKRDAG
jgi:hypothetical protein